MTRRHIAAPSIFSYHLLLGDPRARAGPFLPGGGFFYGSRSEDWWREGENTDERKLHECAAAINHPEITRYSESAGLHPPLRLSNNNNQCRRTTRHDPDERCPTILLRR